MELSRFHLKYSKSFYFPKERSIVQQCGQREKQGDFLQRLQKVWQGFCGPTEQEGSSLWFYIQSSVSFHSNVWELAFLTCPEALAAFRASPGPSV